jgi:uncharacterized protein (TIGR02996 family)
MRSFEFSEGASNKFWNITLNGASFLVNFGKIGTKGQTQVKEFATEEIAQKEHDKLVAEKLKKGYKETTPAGTTGANQVTPPTSPPVQEKTPAGTVKVEQPVPTPKSTPAVAHGTGLRTFTYSDASSHKFWNIDIQGNKFLVTFGRQGTAGTKQEKTFATEEAARKEYDKLISEKLKKGYIETTPQPAASPKNMCEALEAALVENPEDLATHMAYADYLSEQGDAWGELIQIQLRLEQEELKPAERKKLQSEEKKLVEAHLRNRLGDFAPWVLDVQQHPQYSWQNLSAEYTLRRGWFWTLKFLRYSVESMRALVQSPSTRLLHTLHFVEEMYEEEGEYNPGPDLPEDVFSPQLFPLVKARYLSNVRVLIVGEPTTPEDEIEAYYNCHTSGDAVSGIVKQMPKIEELHLYAHRVNGNELFSLRTMPDLRVLILYHSMQYPLGRLAKNPNLKKLEVIRFHPHAVEDFDEGAYIKLAGIRELVRSAELPALRHLQLRSTDAGDKGVKEIVESGILKRLKILDLRHGVITDKGADLFLNCPDSKRLERLDLGHNKITETKAQQLLAAGIQLVYDNQRDPNSDDEDGEGYLSSGDIE